MPTTSGNTSPLFAGAADNSWGTTAITSANTAKDGTGTVLLVFTANSADGDFLQEVRFCSAGTNVASVARIFLNNGSTNATPANNILIGEITLSATTISETSAQPIYVFPVNKLIATTQRIYVTIGTAVAAGYYVSAFGTKY